MVIQTEYGVSRPWYWPFVAPFARFRMERETIQLSNNTDLEAAAAASNTVVPEHEKISSNDTLQSDHTNNDVISERERISISATSDYPLIISKARKRFGKKLAVKDVSVAIGSGEILALLGPNGAGKTTLVNCVLGLYRLSSGSARINGFDIIHQQDQVYRHIGICPQHEILWPDLT